MLHRLLEITVQNVFVCIGILQFFSVEENSTKVLLSFLLFIIDRRPVLEGDNWWRGHAAAFLRHARLPATDLRKGRVLQVLYINVSSVRFLLCSIVPEMQVT